MEKYNFDKNDINTRFIFLKVPVYCRYHCWIIIALWFSHKIKLLTKKINQSIYEFYCFVFKSLAIGNELETVAVALLLINWTFDTYVIWVVLNNQGCMVGRIFLDPNYNRWRPYRLDIVSPSSDHHWKINKLIIRWTRFQS